MGDTEAIRAILRQAFSNLGIRAEIPFLLPGPDAFECDAYLPDFGGPTGMVVCTRFSLDDSSLYSRLAKAAKGSGLYISTMALSRELDLAEIMDAMADWGYYGPSERRPSWLPIR